MLPSIGIQKMLVPHCGSGTGWSLLERNFSVPAPTKSTSCMSISSQRSSGQRSRKGTRMIFLRTHVHAERGHMTQRQWFAFQPARWAKSTLTFQGQQLPWPGDPPVPCVYSSFFSDASKLWWDILCLTKTQDILLPAVFIPLRKT
jgi:hypothetical protein